MRPRVLIADDHHVAADRLRSLLEKSHDVIGVVQDGRQLLAEAPKLQPDVVVLDVCMPVLNGLDAAKQLKQVLPTVKFVFLTMNNDPYLTEAALKLGTVGYVLKSFASRELSAAILEVLQGRSYVRARLRNRNTEGGEATQTQQFSGELPPRQEGSDAVTTRRSSSEEHGRVGLVCWNQQRA